MLVRSVSSAAREYSPEGYMQHRRFCTNAVEETCEVPETETQPYNRLVQRAEDGI